jgi:hypothetical protein
LGDSRERFEGEEIMSNGVMKDTFYYIYKIKGRLGERCKGKLL